MVEKLPDSAVVRNGIAESKQMHMAPAIKPYSIAVAPFSFLRNAWMFIFWLFFFDYDVAHYHRRQPYHPDINRFWILWLKSEYSCVFPIAKIRMAIAQWKGRLLKSALFTIKRWICLSRRSNLNYLPAVIDAPIVVKRPERASVMNGIAASKQIAIAEAMRPYSIAVAPDWSFKNFFILLSKMTFDIYAVVSSARLAVSNH